MGGNILAYNSFKWGLACRLTNETTHDIVH